MPETHVAAGTLWRGSSARDHARAYHAHEHVRVRDHMWASTEAHGHDLPCSKTSGGGRPGSRAARGVRAWWLVCVRCRWPGCAAAHRSPRVRSTQKACDEDGFYVSRELPKYANWRRGVVLEVLTENSAHVEFRKKPVRSHAPPPSWRLKSAVMTSRPPNVSGQRLHKCPLSPSPSALRCSRLWRTLCITRPRPCGAAPFR